MARRIEISGNRIDGFNSFGVQLVPACCGGGRNRIEDVHIQDNVLRGVRAATGVFVSGGESKRSNTVSDVTIHANTIVLDFEGGGFTPGLGGGGIGLVGGESPARNSAITDVVITSNRVDTKLVGISLLGGSAFQPPRSVKDNRVSDVDVRCNVIARVPVLLTDLVQMVRGINLTGGSGLPIFFDTRQEWSATGNSVTCVRLQDNLVAGVLNDVSVIDDVGTGASGNAASRGGC